MERDREKGFVLGCIGIVVVLGAIFLIGSYCNNLNGVFEIQALNVKQGSMLLIKNGRENILLGGAGVEEAKDINDYLARQGVKRINYAVWYSPTKEYTGGYDKLIYSIPIDHLYVYQEELMDYESEEIMGLLRQANCKIKMLATSNLHKSRYNKVRIAVGKIQNHQEQTKICVEIKAPKLNYVWIPGNDLKSDLIEESDISKSKQILKPTILNISGDSRTDYFDKTNFDLQALQMVIMGSTEPLTFVEKKKLDENILTCPIIESSIERTNIVYRENEKYYITTWKQLGMRVL